jgi:hypothetical protein
MGHPLPQVLQRRSQKARHLGRFLSSVTPHHRTEIRFFAGPNFAILTKSQRILHPFMALWCNWLTRRPLKAKSPGSSPGNATKIPNKINRLTASQTSHPFAIFVLVALWWHFCRAVRYQSSDADSAPRSPKHPPRISAWTLERSTNDIPQIAERSRGRSGVKAAHARRCAVVEP